MVNATKRFAQLLQLKEVILLLLQALQWVLHSSCLRSIQELRRIRIPTARRAMPLVVRRTIVVVVAVVVVVLVGVIEVMIAALWKHIRCGTDANVRITLTIHQTAEYKYRERLNDALFWGQWQDNVVSGGSSGSWSTYSLDRSTYLRDSDIVLSILLRKSFMHLRFSSSGVIAATESRDLLCLALHVALWLCNIRAGSSSLGCTTSSSPAIEYGRGVLCSWPERVLDELDEMLVLQLLLLPLPLPLPMPPPLPLLS